MTGGPPKPKRGAPDPKGGADGAGAGSIWRIRGSRYAVQGATDLYEVDAKTGHCTCASYAFQKGGTLDQYGRPAQPGVRCKHGRWLRRYLAWRATLGPMATAREDLVEAVKQALLSLQRGTEATIGKRTYWCIEGEAAVGLADTLRHIERELKEDQPDATHSHSQ